MNLIKLFVAVIVLALMAVPVIRAQETQTPTENATPTPAEKSETETLKPSDAESSATPAEKSAAKKEKSDVTPAAKAPASAAAAGKPAAKGSVEAQLKDLENQWETAFQTHNVSAVEPFLADDYVLTTEKGEVLNRSGALKHMKKDTDVYDKAANSKMAVHMINRDAAVVTGMSHETGKDKSGKPFDRTFRWTDTFVTRNGRWQCVATQVTLIAQK